MSSIAGAVNGVTNPSYTYDANGNMTAGAGRTVTYMSFNTVDIIAQGSSTFALTTLMLANMMSELRKYAVGRTLTYQHLLQLEPDTRRAELENAGTLMSFRVGAEEASHLAKEVQPTCRATRSA